MATKTKAPPEPDRVADLQSQLHEVKQRASEQNAELERAGRREKALTKERDDALALKDENKTLKAKIKQLEGDLAAANSALAAAQSYAQSNEGEARKLQQIREAIA